MPLCYEVISFVTVNQTTSVEVSLPQRFNVTSRIFINLHLLVKNIP